MTRSTLIPLMFGFGVAAACGSPAAPTSRPPASVASVSTQPTPSGQAAGLGVEASAMIAFHYTGDPKWFYAPQLRVHETSGTGGVSITGARFTIPGFVTQQWTCSAGQHLNGGETRELFPEIYGDYPLTFDDSSGRDPGNPMVEIIFVDDSGQAGVLSAKLPVTPGSLPTTYSGGSGSWTCR